MVRLRGPSTRSPGSDRITAPLANAAGPRPAGPELLVLQKWEAFCGWLLEHTRRWPKSARFTLTQRIENHALDLTELLVEARYVRRARPRLLREANLKLERMRFLCRIAKTLGIMPKRGFESAMRHVDEAGRMIHGWRVAIGERPARPAATETLALRHGRNPGAGVVDALPAAPFGRLRRAWALARVGFAKPWQPRRTAGGWGEGLCSREERLGGRAR